jgi:hypothetical protein
MKNIIGILLEPAVIIAVAGSIAAAIRFLYIKIEQHKSFNRALLSEISRLLRVIVRHKRFWSECIKNGDTDLPLINFSTDVYDTLIKEWRDVDSSYAAAAASFYGYIGFLNRLQGTKDKYPGDKMKMFDAIYLNALEAINRDYFNKFDKAFEKFHVDKPN